MILHKIRYFLFNLLSIALICYFGYHIINGDRGVFALLKLNNQINSLTSELETTRVERLSLERKANLLKSNSLDLDLLEEQVKNILGYAKPQEHILIDDNQN